MSADELGTAMQRLITQVGHWETGRWSTAAASGGGLRGEVVRSLVQRLADHGADVEHREHRPVPRLADTVLPDQLRVMEDDLIAAGPPESLLARAAADLNRTRTLL